MRPLRPIPSLTLPVTHPALLHLRLLRLRDTSQYILQVSHHSWLNRFQLRRQFSPNSLLHLLSFLAENIRAHGDHLAVGLVLAVRLRTARRSINEGPASDLGSSREQDLEYPHLPLDLPGELTEM